MTNTTVCHQHKYERRADGVLESGTAYSRRWQIKAGPGTTLEKLHTSNQTALRDTSCDLPFR